MSYTKKRVQKFFSGVSMTKQSFKDQCDINVIMKRFRNVCGADFLSKYNGYVDGQFGDFSVVPDYRDALDQVRKAGEVFSALPAKVRSRFYNDPAEFLDFCQNPANKDELVNLGLSVPSSPSSSSSSAPPSSVAQSTQQGG